MIIKKQRKYIKASLSALTTMALILAGCSEERKPVLIGVPRIPTSIVHPHVTPRGFVPVTKDDLWHLFGENGINIGPAWDITTGSKDVTIAVIDGQFSPDNPAFSQGRCSATTEYFNFIKEEKLPGYHGAAVTSLINTCEDNPLGLISINKKSRILWIEESPQTLWADYDLMRWAMGNSDMCGSERINCSEANEHPAQVINFSFGGPGSGKKIALDVVAQDANQRGSVIVAGAGNESRNADNTFPSAANGIISVGATTRKGKAASFSNWGKTVDIMAPGHDLWAASDMKMQNTEGTSLAAPIISGVISLMRSVYPSLNWKTARYFLQATAIKMDCRSYCISGRSKKAQDQCKKDCCVGEAQICTPGRVDAGAAVAAAQKAGIEGLPRVALVDSNKYFVEIEEKDGNFKLFNVGGAKGTYTLSSPEGMAIFDGNRKTLNVVLAAKGEPGDSVEIKFTTINNDDPKGRILITSLDPGLGGLFPDEMSIYFRLYRPYYYDE